MSGLTFRLLLQRSLAQMLSLERFLCNFCRAPVGVPRLAW
jgi:hypothetical protein